jgi:hypothetical protein
VSIGLIWNDLERKIMGVVIPRQLLLGNLRRRLVTRFFVGRWRRYDSLQDGWLIIQTGVLRIDGEAIDSLPFGITAALVVVVAEIGGTAHRRVAKCPCRRDKVLSH